MLWVETMSSLEEVKASIHAAVATGLAVAACMTFDTAAKTMMGVSPAEFVIQSAGFGPAELLHSVREMLPATDVPVIAKGNCGIPAYVDSGIHYHATPELIAEYACFARYAAIKIIGGCCGTTPEHVAAMAAALAGSPSRPFDEVDAEAAPGTPWKDLPTPPAGGEDAASRRSRGRRRSRG